MEELVLVWMGKEYGKMHGKGCDLILEVSVEFLLVHAEKISRERVGDRKVMSMVLRTQQKACSGTSTDYASLVHHPEQGSRGIFCFPREREERRLPVFVCSFCAFFFLFLGLGLVRQLLT